MFRHRVDHTSHAKEFALARQLSSDREQHKTATDQHNNAITQHPVQPLAAWNRLQDSARQVLDYPFYHYYYSPVLSSLPMYFAVFYVIYIGALVIKGAAQHKILYSDQRSFSSPSSGDLWVNELSAKVTNALTSAAIKYVKTLHNDRT